MVGVPRDVKQVVSTDITRLAVLRDQQWATKSPESEYLQFIPLQGRRKKVFTIVIISTVDTEAVKGL